MRKINKCYKKYRLCKGMYFCLLVIFIEKSKNLFINKCLLFCKMYLFMLENGLKLMNYCIKDCL